MRVGGCGCSCGLVVVVGGDGGVRWSSRALRFWSRRVGSVVSRGLEDLRVSDLSQSIF